jgi:hypothetical protein
LVGLWEGGREGRIALPTHVDRVVVLDPSGEAAAQSAGPLVATARPADAGVFDCVVTDSTGNVAVRLTGYRTIALPQGLAEDVQAPLRSVMAG